MTETSRYDALLDRIEVLYGENQLQAAIDLLAAESVGLAAWAAELAHLKACLLGAAGEADAALRTLQDWALTARPTRAAGVVVMAPALRELPDAAAGSLSPATILIGTGDDLLEVVDEAAERLTGFGCAIERVPELTHAFPADFGARLTRILG